MFESERKARDILTVAAEGRVDSDLLEAPDDGFVDVRGLPPIPCGLGRNPSMELRANPCSAFTKTHVSARSQVIIKTPNDDSSQAEIERGGSAAIGEPRYMCNPLVRLKFPRLDRERVGGIVDGPTARA
jgi:hypothetical protein